MLRTNDIVVVKDAKGHVIATKEYERVYLSHSQEDETEVVDVSADGNVVGKKTRPKGSSKTSAEDLFSTAVEFLQKDNPKSNPLIVILESVQYAQDLKARAAIRASLLPPKEVDPDKAVDQMAKKLMAVNQSLSLDEAKAAIRALLPA